MKFDKLGFFVSLESTSAHRPAGSFYGVPNGPILSKIHIRRNIYRHPPYHCFVGRFYESGGSLLPRMGWLGD